MRANAGAATILLTTLLALAVVVGIAPKAQGSDDPPQDSNEPPQTAEAPSAPEVLRLARIARIEEIRRKYATSLPAGASFDPASGTFTMRLEVLPSLPHISAVGIGGQTASEGRCTRRGRDLGIHADERSVWLQSSLRFSSMEFGGSLRGGGTMTVILKGGEAERDEERAAGASQPQQDEAEASRETHVVINHQGLRVLAERNGRLIPLAAKTPAQALTGQQPFSLRYQNNTLELRYAGLEAEVVVPQRAYVSLTLHVQHQPVFIRGGLLKGVVSRDWIEQGGYRVLDYNNTLWRMRHLGQAPLFADFRYALPDDALARGLAELDKEAREQRLKGEVAELLKRYPRNELVRFDALLNLRKGTLSLESPPGVQEGDSVEYRLLAAEVMLRQGDASSALRVLEDVGDAAKDWRLLALKVIAALRTGDVGAAQSGLASGAAVLPTGLAGMLRNAAQYLAEVRQREGASEQSLLALEFVEGKAVENPAARTALEEVRAEYADFSGQAVSDDFRVTLCWCSSLEQMSDIVVVLGNRGMDQVVAAYWFDSISNVHRILAARGLAEDPRNRYATRHELWHAFMHDALPMQAAKPWLNEGLAMLLSMRHQSNAASVEGDKAANTLAIPYEIADLPDALKLASERGAKLPAKEGDSRTPAQRELARIMQLSLSDFYGPQDIAYHYSLAWAAVALALGETPPQEQAFVKALRAGTIDALVLEAFDPARLLKLLEADSD